MSKKVAFITGIAGQDGSYLADFLLKKKYQVIGITEQVVSSKLWRLDYFGIRKHVKIIQGTIADAVVLKKILTTFKPAEIYNLAGVTTVAEAWKDPVKNFTLNALAPVSLLKIMMQELPTARFFQASSSEIYGDTRGVVVNEQTSNFKPLNPYGSAKLAVHLTLQNFRREYGIYAVNGILFNHESPLRAESFFTKSAVSKAVKISRGALPYAEFGNIKATRDFGFAGDFVRAMWLTLQQAKARDYIICTGKINTVEDLLKITFQKAGLAQWRSYIRIASRLTRKNGSRGVEGSNVRLRRLGWKPTIGLEDLIGLMLEYEYKKIS